MMKEEPKERREVMPETGWSAAKATRSAKDGTKALSQSTEGSISAHIKEFAISVCNSDSFGA